jgi:hypothetical protein
MRAASGEGGVRSGPLLWPDPNRAAARYPMSGEEEHLSPKELIEREYQIKRREYDELQQLIEERCRAAEMLYWATHPWLSSAATTGLPGWCVTVPVQLLVL